jgi:hypothetical protein
LREHQKNKKNWAVTPFFKKKGKRKHSLPPQVKAAFGRHRILRSLTSIDGLFAELGL